MGNHVYWDFLALFDEMKNGLRQAVRKGYRIRSIGIDTWGVDFGLIDRNGNLLGNPVCYRDPRTDGLPEEFFGDNLVRHYSEAGIQVMSINTLFQLYSMKKSGDTQLEVADRLLFMPDLFQLLPHRGWQIMNIVLHPPPNCLRRVAGLGISRSSSVWGVPAHLFGDIVMPGTVRGKLKREIAEEIGLTDEVDVIAVGSHDTASAVYAIPSTQVDKSRCAFSFCRFRGGGWGWKKKPSLRKKLGGEGLTKEGGQGGRVVFFRYYRATGLWILQRLIAQWKERGENDVDTISCFSAAESADIPSVIDVDDKIFQNPVDMEDAIAEYCEAHGQPIPETYGEVVRCVLQSLALRYKQGIDQLNRLLPAPIEQLNIIGGGCRNSLLNRLTAKALGIPVYAGPVEATAIGSILVQAITKGEIGSREDIKEFI